MHNSSFASTHAFHRAASRSSTPKQLRSLRLHGPPDRIVPDFQIVVSCFWEVSWLLHDECSVAKRTSIFIDQSFRGNVESQRARARRNTAASPEALKVCMIEKKFCFDLDVERLYRVLDLSNNGLCQHANYNHQRTLCQVCECMSRREGHRTSSILRHPPKF